MKLKIEYVPVSKIKPYAGNAKKHPAEQVEQIKKSIEEFGFNDPIAVWNGEVVEGHGRLIAATELGLDKVPIIRLDELTDAQRKAYTLVHNKLTLNSGFDADMLSLELGELENEIDLSEYGFDFDDIVDDDGYYGDERERTNNAYNLHALGSVTLTVIPTDLIGFNYAKTSKGKDVGIHFYVDDYQFERLWNAPDKYTEMLAEYECILSPDFSLYMDMPMPMKIWNTYRSRQIGAYYQAQGIKVIPTLSWAEPETFEFCFRGIEQGGVVSVSTVGVKRDKKALETWAEGMKEAIRQTSPSAVLLYGGDIGFDFGKIRVIEYKNHVTEDWK